MDEKIEKLNEKIDSLIEVLEFLIEVDTGITGQHYEWIRDLLKELKGE